MKTCKCCKIEKELSEFSIGYKRGIKIYYASYCKPCCSIKSKEYAQKNPEKVKKYNRTNWGKNKDQIIQKKINLELILGILIIKKREKLL